MALNVRRKFKNRLYEVRLINTLLNLPLWLALWMAGGKKKYFFCLIFIPTFKSRIKIPYQQALKEKSSTLEFTAALLPAPCYNGRPGFGMGHEQLWCYDGGAIHDSKEGVAIGDR